jgi:protein-disulfide isomerase
MARGLILAAIGLAAAGPMSAAEAAPRRAAAAPARADWTRTVVATPQGGYRMGNPNARVKLVEYGSITCPHCALFAAQGGGPLRSNYVKSGRVSWEYRPFMIFPTDPGLFMLLRCQGAARFFATSDRLYADQRAWAGKLQSLPQERVQQLQAMSAPQRIAALVAETGTSAYFRGMAPARVKACLADSRNLNSLLAITEQANKEGVSGTPSFFVNGKLTGALDWAGLEPFLKSAGG